MPTHLLDLDLICGIDEVGRCGAGPVVAAAVILPKSFHPLPTKKLSENKGMKRVNLSML
jgi:ribonuclease HII